VVFKILIFGIDNQSNLQYKKRLSIIFLVNFWTTFIAFCLRPTAKLSAEGLQSTFWPTHSRTLLQRDTQRPLKTLLMANDKWQWYMGHVWDMAQVWHPLNVSNCDTMWHYDKKSSQITKEQENLPIWKWKRLDTLWHYATLWHFCDIKSLQIHWTL
jgi:hypothetical protein